MSIPNILYHYCSVDSFHKIIQSNEMWLSDSYVLNDYRENTWIIPIIEEKFNNIRNDTNSQLIDKIMETYRLNDYIPFVSCFSSEGDVLSQWRAYAVNGTGVAIGINAGSLSIKNLIPVTGQTTDVTLGVSEVFYDEEYQREIVSKTIDRNFTFFEKKVWDFDKVALETAMVLKKYSSVFKNPKFREEQEWRIIHTPLIMGDPQNTTTLMGNISDLNFRVSDGKLISYFSLSFSKYINGEPFSEIVLGPKCTILSHSIGIYLSANGHKETTIRVYQASYR